MEKVLPKIVTQLLSEQSHNVDHDEETDHLRQDNQGVVTEQADHHWQIFSHNAFVDDPFVEHGEVSVQK